MEAKKTSQAQQTPRFLSFGRWLGSVFAYLETVFGYLVLWGGWEDALLDGLADIHPWR